jgi:hypothetical protein
MHHMKLLLATLIGLVMPAVAGAQDNPCGVDGSCPLAGELKLIVDHGALLLPQLPDYSDAPDAELAHRSLALERRAAALAPYVDSYVTLMDRVAGANFALWARLADATAIDAAERDRYRTHLFMMPGAVDWNRELSYDQKKLMEAAVKELIRQLRQDLRAGHTSAPFDPGDIAGESTPAGVVAALRLNQLLQQARIPTDFEALSPTSVADVRGLQALDEGVFPDARTQPAAFEAMLYATRDAPDGRFMRYAERGEVPPGTLGLDETLPNGEPIAALLDELVREQLAINQALEARGDTPARTPTLDALVGQVSALDSNIGRVGKAFVDQLHGGFGFTEEYMVIGYKLEKVPQQLYRPHAVAGPGSRGYESHRLSGALYIFPSTEFAPGAPLSPEELDELVRVKDSAELLAGNASGLGLEDVPMSEGLRRRLGLEGAYTPPEFPAGYGQLIPTPFQRILRKRGDRPAMIDLAAVVPQEFRGDYLLTLNREAFGRSLDARSETELIAYRDNTWLNRTVEVLDFPGWIFKGNDPDSWIGPRAERNLKRSKYWGELVDEHTDRIAEDAIYGRYAPAMGGLREVMAINNRHEALNVRYAYQNEETEFATMMYVGFLPLSLFGVAETGVTIARPVMARLGVRTTASLVDDVARSADDLARLADDALRATDDVVRAADDVVTHGDDLARLAQLDELDDLAELGDDLSRAADDLTRVSDELGKAGDSAADELGELVDELVPDGANGSLKDRVYHNRSGTQQLHVDADAEPALREAVDTALTRINRGATTDERLAHLVDHVHSDVTYDAAAQQAKYLTDGALPPGQARLGEMIQDGAVVCREKAIFTHQLLSEMGIPSKVVTGNVAMDGGRYGHAWVQLADGTVIDGTWGRIYPRGAGYPVDEVIKSQVFSAPKRVLSPAQIEQAVGRASVVLEVPEQLKNLRGQAAGAARLLTAEEQLLSNGARVTLPVKKGGVSGWFGGKKQGLITRVERDLVFVEVDGAEQMFSRQQILELNRAALPPTTAPPAIPPRPRSWRGE